MPGIQQQQLDENHGLVAFVAHMITAVQYPMGYSAQHFEWISRAYLSLDRFRFGLELPTGGQRLDTSRNTSRTVSHQGLLPPEDSKNSDGRLVSSDRQTCCEVAEGRSRDVARPEWFQVDPVASIQSEEPRARNVVLVKGQDAKPKPLIRGEMSIEARYLVVKDAAGSARPSFGGRVGVEAGEVV
ncbi:hypothetical protein GSI_10472 [Ganoderma sinense ZZ0214-1]|uniref:Uncharacterized protein n=1 Tax=Ganoderma sinense ZZ0214-1 TaxID=1077348 RepID=A0A2G8S0Q0_9APHY|nr:hypothetical protein GSI_10472 [Ganoderma sinense ZZ0214-1]